MPTLKKAGVINTIDGYIIFACMTREVGNLDAPVEELTVGGTALTSLMDVERRHGKFKPVIKKAMVELEGTSHCWSCEQLETA
ncbi:hypothetical protein L1049_015779 [Liquidambar formosana]|uniref:Uncharacterized protein n=1 Tax=Liquidambar formosana TaxID=63359 RepID=A0AAP0X240_LIQFO